MNDFLPGIYDFVELVLAPLVGHGAVLPGDPGNPLDVPGGEETLGVNYCISKGGG